MKYISIDLFSGAGGMSEGLRMAHFKTKYAFEIDAIASMTYKLNHNRTKVYTQDIKTVDTNAIKRALRGRTIHLLAGCPPCQGFSSIRRLNRNKPVDDERNSLINEYVRFVNDLRPYTIMLENVPGLAMSDEFHKAIYFLREIGYHIEYDILKRDKETRKYNPGEYAKENIIRTTFYQDYSNTDFVGQILPKIVRGKNGEKDTVEYIFNPGPFTLALIRAISNPDKKVALVVEEINRGNAPAIFGDVFQLLDRDENGISEYGIVNVGVMDYLNDYEFEVNGEKKRYLFKEIKIPGNMYIFATMNTSDQNVYTLDTAFVRRWDKEKIKNSFAGCKLAPLPVPGMESYTWKEFVEGINKCIANHLEDLQVNEDKQIGAFFVKESLLKNKNAEEFAYKVFDYLWSDVAKLDHGVFFNAYETLEDLIDAFKNKGVGVFKTGIFEEKHSASSQITEQTQEDDSNE